MTRDEKRLTALIVAANLLLGLMLIQRAELGRLFMSGEGGGASIVDSGAVAPAVHGPAEDLAPTPRD